MHFQSTGVHKRLFFFFFYGLFGPLDHLPQNKMFLLFCAVDRGSQTWPNNLHNNFRPVDLIFHKPHHTSLAEGSCFGWICFTFFVEASERRECEGGKIAIYRRFLTKSVCSAHYGRFPRCGRTGNYLKSTGRLEECYGGAILQGSRLQRVQVSFANTRQLLSLTPRVTAKLLVKERRGEGRMKNPANSSSIMRNRNP